MVARSSFRYLLFVRNGFLQRVWRVGMTLMLLIAGGVAPLHAQDAEHPMEVKGVQTTRGSFSLLPWESLDTYSGSVVLTFADLVLPGNAGLDLRVTRSFNSKGESWHIGVGPSMIIPPDVPSPYGPRRHPRSTRPMVGCNRRLKRSPARAST